jgi:hypothetical protein
MLTRRIVALALQMVTVTAFAQACPPPSFDTFRPSADAMPEGVEYRSSNIVRMRIPGDAVYIASLPAALGLRYANGVRITLSLDDGSALQKENTQSPASRYIDAFTGRTPEACALTAHWLQLSESNYRVRHGSGAFSVYAFGVRDTQYEFVTINSNHPEFVLRGLVKGMSHSAFEALLSTMKPLETP